MITVTFAIPAQKIPTQDLRALFAAALIRGADDTTTYAGDDAVRAAASAIMNATVTETF
jgi:hypothetical protein